MKWADEDIHTIELSIGSINITNDFRWLAYICKSDAAFRGGEFLFLSIVLFWFYWFVWKNASLKTFTFSAIAVILYA